jgi:hypothetical protein
MQAVEISQPKCYDLYNEHWSGHVDTEPYPFKLIPPIRAIERARWLRHWADILARSIQTTLHAAVEHGLTSRNKGGWVAERVMDHLYFPLINFWKSDFKGKYVGSNPKLRAGYTGVKWKFGN